MLRLAHLSDIHLGPLPDIKYRELASKRITGYINWQRNRKTNLHDYVIGLILDDIKAQAPDHIAVTGDLVNLALDAEIEFATQWLEEVGAGDGVSVVPGNHDAYVPGALDKACRAWGKWMWGDGMAQPARRGAFPYMRVRGKMALIGVSSARATAPFMASGYFGSTQARRLGQMLDEAKANGLCRVIMIHHPPVRGAAPQHKRLFGIGRFKKVMQKHGAELVLHGHTHLPSLYWLDGKDGKVPVLGVAAAGQAVGGSKPAAQFNLIEIDGEPGAWRLNVERRGLLAGSNDIQKIVAQTLESGSGSPVHEPTPSRSHAK
ncbi:metallophosphoesterase family protein [Aliihoeflea sp. PC F10.4]